MLTWLQRGQATPFFQWHHNPTRTNLSKCFNALTDRFSIFTFALRKSLAKMVRRPCQGWWQQPRPNAMVATTAKDAMAMAKAIALLTWVVWAWARTSMAEGTTTMSVVRLLTTMAWLRVHWNKWQYFTVFAPSAREACVCGAW